MLYWRHVTQVDCDVPQWRNWQTRYVQDVVGTSSWGFKSLLRHQIEETSKVGGSFFVLWANWRPSGPCIKQAVVRTSLDGESIGVTFSL